MCGRRRLVRRAYAAWLLGSAAVLALTLRWHAALRASAEGGRAARRLLPAAHQRLASAHAHTDVAPRVGAAERELSVLHWNIALGSTDTPRWARICEFLERRRFDVVGFAELGPGASEFGRAAAAHGYPYSEYLRSADGRFNLGLIAREPIARAVSRTDGYAHGLLCVDLGRAAVRVCEAHLSAHSRTARLREAERLHAESQLGAGERRTLLLADLNALSRLDAAAHVADGLLAQLLQPGADKRARAKFVRGHAATPTAGAGEAAAGAARAAGERESDAGPPALDYAVTDALAALGWRDLAQNSSTGQSTVTPAPAAHGAAAGGGGGGLKLDAVHSMAMRLDYALLLPPRAGAGTERCADDRGGSDGWACALGGGGCAEYARGAQAAARVPQWTARPAARPYVDPDAAVVRPLSDHLPLHVRVRACALPADVGPEPSQPRRATLELAPHAHEAAAVGGALDGPSAAAPPSHAAAVAEVRADSGVLGARARAGATAARCADRATRPRAPAPLSARALAPSARSECAAISNLSQLLALGGRAPGGTSPLQQPAAGGGGGSGGTAPARAPLWRSCAVVGSSGVLLHARLGDEIDAHDAVLRLNAAPTAQYARHVGRRTTVRLVNSPQTHAWQAALRAGQALPAEVTEAALVLTMGTPSRFLRGAPAAGTTAAAGGVGGVARAARVRDVPPSSSPPSPPAAVVLPDTGTVVAHLSRAFRRTCVQRLFSAAELDEHRRATRTNLTATFGFEAVVHALYACEAVDVYGFYIDEADLRAQPTRPAALGGKRGEKAALRVPYHYFEAASFDKAAQDPARPWTFRSHNYALEATRLAEMADECMLRVRV